ncbi:VP3 [Yonaguni orbivirus]|nr:VP3 [Yonaguni orbivirus]
MAEYGILIWHDTQSRSGQKVEYPGEYDIILNLDSRVEPQAKTKGKLMKIATNATILRQNGSIDIAAFNETLQTHLSSETMKKPLHDIISRGFIDRCIVRLTEEDKKENIKRAVLRAKFEPYWMGLSYNKAGAGMSGIQLTHSEVVTRKHVMQTAFVERRSVCAKRVHLDGLERTLSQMVSFGLMACYLGKVYLPSRTYANLMDQSGNTKSIYFSLEIVRKTHEIIALPASPVTSDVDYFETLIQAENKNKTSRTENILGGEVTQAMKHYFEDFIEEIKDVMQDVKINKDIALYGRESRLYPNINIIAWRSANDSLARDTVKQASSRSDLKRIPLKTHGIYSLFMQRMTSLIVEIGESGNLKTCAQPNPEGEQFWKEWLGDIKYQDGGSTDRLLKTLYQGTEMGCEMEQVILITLYETVSFLYASVTRAVTYKFKKNLLKELISGIKLSPSKDEKIREANELKIQAAIDSYMNTKPLHEKWNVKLLELIMDSRSIPLSFIYILRYANGDAMTEIDSDELESDFNLVLLGEMGLESALRVYAPMLCELYQRAQNLNSASTIVEIINVMVCHNLLILLLSLFLEFKIGKMDLGGIPMFKKFVKGKYYVSYLTPNHTGRITKGLHLADTIHYFMDTLLCSEFDNDFYDRFEGLDDERRRKEWDEYVEKQHEKIDLEKVKYGERGDNWAKKQKAELKSRRDDADFRHWLLKCVREIFNSEAYSKRERTLNLVKIDSISHIRLNYQRMSMLMGSSCCGFTDVMSLCLPISAPHKSMVVVCVYSDAITETIAQLCLKNRFKRIHEKIYQIILIKVKPKETQYVDTIDDMTCNERFNVKGLGPMKIRVLPYKSQGLDSKSIIIKSDKGERGSKFFFVKLSGAE